MGDGTAPYPRRVNRIDDEKNERIREPEAILRRNYEWAIELPEVVYPAGLEHDTRRALEVNDER